MPTDNHKILIIVKNHTDYGYFKMALYNSKYSNADIAVFPFPFDAALIPTSLDYKELKNSIENSKISYFDIKLRKFYKIDFSKYKAIYIEFFPEPKASGWGSNLMIWSPTNTLTSVSSAYDITLNGSNPYAISSPEVDGVLNKFYMPILI